MTFAQQITFVRHKLYLSRSKMAKEICVTEQKTIYRLEQGLSKPQIALKRKLINLCKKIKIEE